MLWQMTRECNVSINLRQGRKITILGRALCVAAACQALLLSIPQTGFAEVVMKRIKYHGWQNVYRMANDKVELFVLADLGPRVLRYGFAGGRNEFP